MLMQQAREQITEYGKKMSAAGLAKGTAGNLSVYDPETGYMAINPSGIGYMETTPEDIVVIDLDGNIIEGTRTPSSESNLHAGFYKKRAHLGCHAIVHTHSDYVTTLSAMGEPIRAVHYVIATSGAHEIPICDYVTFGTPELAEIAVNACNDSRAVVLANHGLVAYDTDIAKAFKLAGNLETIAKMQWQCMCAGKMNVLTKEQIDDVLVRFKTYGQSSAPKGSSNGY